MEAGARRGEHFHEFTVHEPPTFPERDDRHAVFNVDPLAHGQAGEQHRVATLVETAKNTGRLAILSRR